MTFEETYLNDNILDALYDMRFEEMTPIQEPSIVSSCHQLANWHNR